MFPRDAIVLVNEITGAQTSILLPATTTTILGIKAQQNLTASIIASDFSVFCGTKQIARTYGKDYTDTLSHFVCINNTINIIKTGPDAVLYNITYVPRNRNLTQDPQSSNSTTSVTMSSSTTMDASTTQLYVSNLHMQNAAMTIVLYVLVIIGFYALVRKFM